MTVVKVFEEVAASRPSKVALIMDDQRLTFADVKQLSDRIGSYFHSKGFRKGDTVALMMETRTEYPCIWLGLAKLGVVTALINTNLRRETLRHSIAAANSKAIIVSAELAGGMYLSSALLVGWLVGSYIRDGIVDFNGTCCFL